KMHRSTCFWFKMHRFLYVESLSLLLLSCYAGVLDEIDIRLRAAVADWWLVCVHLHHSVVDAHRPKRGQDMLDCMHSHRAFADGRGALYGLQIFDPRVDRRLVLQILAFEFN